MFNNKLERKDGICSHGGLIAFVNLNTCWFLLQASFQSVVFLFLLWHLFLCQQRLLVPWNLIDIPPSNLTFIFVNNSLSCWVSPPKKNVSLSPWKLSGLKISQCLLPPASVCTTWNHRILERGQPEIIYSKLLITEKKRMETWRLSFIFSNIKWSWPQVSMRFHTRG